MVPELRGELRVGLQLSCFRRSRPLCTQILPGQGRPPSTILGNRKLETLGYRMMKTVLCQNEGTQRDASSRIPLRSLVLTQYRSVTDRRTDGQTDGYVVAYNVQPLAKLASRRAVKTFSRTHKNISGQIGRLLRL